MIRRRRSTVGRHLTWLFVQGTFFVPMVTGAREFTSYPWVARVAFVVVTLWVGYCVVQNLHRLLRARADEADIGSVMRLAAVGAWFGFVSAGRLIEGSAASKPFGLVAALLAANLLALAARDVIRMRHRNGRDRLTPLSTSTAG